MNHRFAARRVIRPNERYRFPPREDEDARCVEMRHFWAALQHRRRAADSGGAADAAATAASTA
jgi:hypothetical protein